MRDIPIFTTEFGVASLFLKNIPVTKKAYIKILDVIDLHKLLDVCCDFCRSAGAEIVYASGSELLTDFNIYTNIVRMSRTNDLPETSVRLKPVDAETMELWREHYNQKMLNVPAASQISFFDSKKYIMEGGCYLAYENDALIGIGMVADHEIRVVASLCKGAGKEIVAALSKVINHDMIEIMVADNNFKAIDLYKSLGFGVFDTVETWYKII